MAQCVRVAVARISTRRFVALDAVPPSCIGSRPLDTVHAGSPVFVSEGKLNYVCPRCWSVLADGIAAGDLAGGLVRCACGELSQVPG